MKWIRYIFILVFIGLLYFPILNNRAHFIIKSYEGILPAAPTLNVKKLDPFPKQYEDYFDKCLELKPWLVGLNSKLKIKTLEVSPNPDKVIIGKNGWLFLGGKSLEEYRGTNLFSDTELKKLKEKLDSRATYARNKTGGKFYFALIPLKHTIYPEHLPVSVMKVNMQTRADQLLQYLKDDTLITMIDVRDELRATKTSHILYYKTDNHWNSIGGYVAYKKVISVLQKDFPALHPSDLNLFVMDSSQVAAGGEANLLNAGDWYSEPKYIYKPSATCKGKDVLRRGYKPPEGFPYPWDYENVRLVSDSSLPDALIFRDSFCDALIPFFAENFNRSVYIFDAWQFKANFEMVDYEKPDIVLYLVLESELQSLLDFD